MELWRMWRNIRRESSRTLSVGGRSYLRAVEHRERLRVEGDHVANPRRSLQSVANLALDAGRVVHLRFCGEEADAEVAARATDRRVERVTELEQPLHHVVRERHHWRFGARRIRQRRRDDVHAYAACRRAREHRGPLGAEPEW